MSLASQPLEPMAGERHAIVPEDRRLLVAQILLGLGSIGTTVLFGLLAATAYTPYEAWTRRMGFTLQHFRPVHESFAFAWVFLGGVSVVTYYLLCEYGPFSAAERRRYKLQLGLWGLAGIGILLTLLSGRFTGREYGAYPWYFGLMIVAGWLLYARTLVGRVGLGLRDRPVFVLMWMLSVPLFLVSYTESFLWLFEAIGARPIKDLQIQWRSNGVLVGAFNQLAYGCIMYLGCRIRRDFSYAFCRTAFSLFVVGLLNTFTNYGHHTYHVPQSHWIHWIAFIVSMLEVIILAKVCVDFLGLWKAKPSLDPDLRVADDFARSTTLWVFLMLTLSMLIAIPPLNALIHGTHVVVAHSMGSMLGIDTMILLAGTAYLLRALAGRDHPVVRGKGVAWVSPVANLSLSVFWVGWILSGLQDGWTSYTGSAAPALDRFVPYFPLVMVGSGLVLAVALLWLVVVWARVFVSSLARTQTPISVPSEASLPAD